jgi:hypothetical protein
MRPILIELLGSRDLPLVSLLDNEFALSVKEPLRLIRHSSKGQ